MAKMTIYHGSPNVVTPLFGVGKPYNDYGQGFYCTENRNLACEWACLHDTDGFANQYDFDTEGLTLLNLNSPDFNILNWLAILLDNRRFVIGDGLPQRAKEYVLVNFLPDYRTYDVIRGYRADDSYFAYATAFINNTLSLSNLKQAMLLGNLGEQIVLKSERSFSRIKLLCSFPADRKTYFAKFKRRDDAARANYQAIANRVPAENELYVLDIIRNNIKNGDSRL